MYTSRWWCAALNRSRERYSAQFIAVSMLTFCPLKLKDTLRPLSVRVSATSRLAVALAGQGQVFLVTGEAGSGKTALMGAFARRALARHPALLVIGGRCDAHAGGRTALPAICRERTNAVRRMGSASLDTALIFAYEVAVLRGDLPTLADLADELLHVGKDTGLQFFLAYGWAAEGYAQALRAKQGSPQADVNLKTYPTWNAAVGICREAHRAWHRV